MQQDVAVKLLPLITSAQRIANDPELYQALIQLASRSTPERTFEEQATEVASSPVTVTRASTPSTSAAGRSRRINKYRNYRPCKSCRRRNSRCKIIFGLNPRLCEWCMDQGFACCDASLHRREQRQEQATSGSFEDFQTTPATPPSVSAPPDVATEYAFANLVATSGYSGTPIEPTWQTSMPTPNEYYPGVVEGDLVSDPSLTSFQDMNLFDTSTTGGQELLRRALVALQEIVQAGNGYQEQVSNSNEYEHSYSPQLSRAGDSSF